MSLCEVDRRITQSIVLMVTARVNKWTLASFDLKKAYDFQQHGFFESSGSKSFVVCHIFPERRQIWKWLNEMDVCLLAFGTSLIQLKSEKHARANFPAFFRRSLRLDQTEMSTPSSRPTGGPSSQYEELLCVFFLLLCERSAKRDMGSLLTGSQRGGKKIRRASEWEAERRDSASEASGTRGSL